MFYMEWISFPFFLSYLNWILYFGPGAYYSRGYLEANNYTDTNGNVFW